ncbi:MAG TPA: hypothetical protein VHW23_29510 [Kofleriaceae bacterium]|jgi:hypothetical protein|nr:hypothetical protein [Kofleriaceae bacterium]
MSRNGRRAAVAVRTAGNIGVMRIASRISFTIRRGHLELEERDFLSRKVLRDDLAGPRG